MVGLDSSSLLDIDPLFKDRHMLCEWLLCTIAHADHISLVAVDYFTRSLYHDDSCCSYHDSTCILDGMEKFLHDHSVWRHANGLRLRDDFTDEPKWRKVYSSRFTCTQQQDNDSCVLGIDLLQFTYQHVPQMRLHIYHCCTHNTLYQPYLAAPSEALRERMLHKFKTQRRVQ